MRALSQHYFPLACPTGRWTLLATILASSMAFIDSTALNVILPSLQESLAADGPDLFWILNSYLLMLAALIIVGGSLGDKLGRVRVFQAGILVFTLGSAACGFATDVSQLIVFRAIQGVGGAFMIPGSLSIISAVFSKEEKGKAIGSWSAATTIVTVCGPVVGGALADLGWWRSIFFINVPLGIFSMFILHYKVPESRSPHVATIDWLGALLLTISLGTFTFGLLEIPEAGAGHPRVVANLIVGGCTFLAFLIAEKKVKNPMMPLTLFASKTFSGLNLLSFFLYAALGAMMLFLSLNIIQIQGYSQFQAGLTFLPFSAMMLLVARKMGALTDRHGARRFLIAGPAITGVGLLWLAMIGMTAGPSAYWFTFFPPFLIFALGMSITVVPLTTAVMTCLEDSKSGIASGINNSVTRISGTFINASLGALAVVMFGEQVLASASDLLLSNDQLQVITSQAEKLGEAKAPAGWSEELKITVDRIFQASFITTYRAVGFLSAALAFLASLIAIFMVKDR